MALVEKLTQIVSRVNPETGEETSPVAQKKYLLLIFFNNDENTDTEKTFEIITGRDETVKFIREGIESIDLLKSYVMSETVSMDRAVTIYTFLRMCLECNKISEEMQVEIEFDADTLLEFMQNFYELSNEELDALYKEESEQ